MVLKSRFKLSNSSVVPSQYGLNIRTTPILNSRTHTGLDIRFQGTISEKGFLNHSTPSIMAENILLVSGNSLEGEIENTNMNHGLYRLDDEFQVEQDIPENISWFSMAVNKVLWDCTESRRLSPNNYLMRYMSVDDPSISLSVSLHQVRNGSVPKEYLNPQSFIAGILATDQGVCELGYIPKSKKVSFKNYSSLIIMSKLKISEE